MKYIRFIVVIFILSTVAFTIAKKPNLVLSTAQAISLRSSNALITYIPIFYSSNDAEPISVVPDDEDTKSDVRVLDIASENLEILVVDADESTYPRYPPTRKFFHFTDQNVVIQVTFSNLGTNVELTAYIYIFDIDETGVDKWIRNQYRNVCDSDAPMRTDRIGISPQDIEITSTEFMTHEVGTDGNEYDIYRVEYTIPDRVEDNLFELNGFEDAALMHVRTEGELPLLDVNSEHVETVVVDTYDDDRYRYGPTQKFFHFTDQNIVMRAYFSDHNTDFEPSLSVYIFSDGEEGIDNWIRRQYDVGIFSSAWPIHTIHIDQLDYEITATQLMTHEVGTNGDEYDNYSIKYMVSDVVKEHVFELEGFEDEMLVHIRTTDILRALDITSEHVETSVIDTYLDMYRYGPTEKYYHFTDQYAVLKALLPNHTADIEPTFTLYIFDMDETNINEWINKQHPKSAFYWPFYSGFELLEPIHTIDIHPSNYAITSTTLISHEVGTYGDEYDNYNIEYMIDDVIEDEVFEINGFSDALPVHVRIKDIDSDNLRLLDITSENVQTELRVASYPDAYGATKKYFHFTDKNVLLWILIPNHNTRFEPKISLLIFDKDAEVDEWLDGQRNFDVPYEGPVQPIHIIDVGLEHYEITSAQLVEHIVGSLFDRYDKYSISYTIRDMFEENLFELSGFQDEVPLYVIVKPLDEPFAPVQEPGNPERICMNR